MMRIRKNDTVKILSGKDRGKKGKILRAMPKEDKVVVEGLNLITKHVKPKRDKEKGQRIKMAMPLKVSRVMLICSHCHQPIRIGYKILANGQKKRFCRKCKDVFN